MGIRYRIPNVRLRYIRYLYLDEFIVMTWSFLLTLSEVMPEKFQLKIIRTSKPTIRDEVTNDDEFALDLSSSVKCQFHQAYP